MGGGYGDEGGVSTEYVSVDADCMNQLQFHRMYRRLVAQAAFQERGSRPYPLKL